MVRNEADLIRYWLDWMLSQVDRVYVLENGSDDGTAEVLAERAASAGGDLVVIDDPERGYFQAKKMTALAARALADGFAWAVPVDCDELWYAVDGRPVADFLEGLARDCMYVEAPMHHHLPTGRDDRRERNPFRRIGWRQREHGGMGKVACRLRDGLQIHQGNHSAWAPGPGLTARGGLSIRHFPWRSAEQYKGKVRRGAEAYAATDLPETTGEHWRQWGDRPDEAIEAWFWQWGYSAHPEADDSLIYDPVGPLLDAAGVK